jgi:hypothetical protein
MHQDSNFDTLYDAIEKRLRERSATSALEAEKEAKAAERATDSVDNVTAKNGSTSIGNIQIGGNVSGNIVIGNNNQVTNKK